MNQPIPNFWKVSATIAALFCLLVAGVHRGDPAQVIEYPTGMKPCNPEFFDPWSGVTDCE